MRKVVVGLAILAILVVAGLVAAPRLIDLSYLKGEIATYVRERTGRRLDIAGPIGLTLVPTPSISARDVRFANPPGAASPDMVRLRAVDVKLAFWPLLTGRIEITSATLVDPEIDLERLPNGTPNWRFPAAAAGAPGEAPAGEAPGTTTRKTAAFAVRQLAIQNGSVTYRSAQTVERFEHINATVVVDSLAGPFHADGELVARGASLTFGASGGTVAAGTMPLHLMLATTPAARLEFDGRLSGLDGAPQVAGTLKLTAEDTASVVSTLARVPVPGGLARPLSLTADVSGSAQALTLDHVALDLGTAHATGRLLLANAAVPTVDLLLRIARLDLDKWSATHKTEATPAGPMPGLIGRAFAAPEATAPIPAGNGAAIGGLRLPEGLKLGIDIGIEAVLWRGGVVRQARTQATLENGRLAVKQLAALLPGGSDVALSGTLATPQGTPHLDGTGEIHADDLRGLLGWLGVDLGGVPADRLRRASFSSRIALAGDRLDLGDIDGTLDATRLKGAATVALHRRPGIGLRLTADRVNLDAYLPQAATAPNTATAGDAAAGAAPTGDAAAAPATDPAENVLGRFDANLDARVGELTWRGQPLRDLHLDGTLQAGSLSIRALEIGDLGGAKGKLSGVVGGLGDGPLKGQLAYDLQGPEFERLLRLAAPGTLEGQDFGAFTLGGSVQASDGGLTLDSDLQVLGGRVHVAGDLTRDTGAVDLGFKVEHPRFDGLVRSFAPTYRPQGGDLGPLKLAGRVKGSATQFTLDRLSLAIGSSTLAGRVGVTLAAPRPKLTADLKLGDWQIDRLLPAQQTAAIDAMLPRLGLRPGVVLAQAMVPASGSPASDRWSRAPLDWSALRLADADLTLAGHSIAYGKWRLDQPMATVTLDDGKLDIGKLAGSIFGGSVEASGGLQAAATPSVRARLSLRDADLKAALANAAGLGLVDGRVDLDATVASTGGSELDLVSHLGGEATVKARDGTLSGVDLKAIEARLNHLDRPADLLGLLKAGSAGGTTHFSALDGTFRIENGVVRSDNLHLVAAGGDGRATTVLDLPGWTMQTRIAFQLTGVPNAPPLVMRLEGPIDAPRKVFDVNPLTQFLAQRLLKGVAPAQPAPDDGKVKPEKLLQNLLKGLTNRP